MFHAPAKVQIRRLAVENFPAVEQRLYFQVSLIVKNPYPIDTFHKEIKKQSSETDFWQVVVSLVRYTPKPHLPFRILSVILCSRLVVHSMILVFWLALLKIQSLFFSFVLLYRLVANSRGLNFPVNGHSFRTWLLFSFTQYISLERIHVLNSRYLTNSRHEFWTLQVLLCSRRQRPCPNDVILLSSMSLCHLLRTKLRERLSETLNKAIGELGPR